MNCGRGEEFFGESNRPSSCNSCGNQFVAASIPVTVTATNNTNSDSGSQENLPPTKTKLPKRSFVIEGTTFKDSFLADLVSIEYEVDGR